MRLIKAVCEFIKFQKHYYLKETETIFEALVEAVIPRESLLDIHKYHIWSLNYNLSIAICKVSFRINLSNATARMLELAARQLVYLGENKEPLKRSKLYKGSTFIALVPEDRFRAINLLEKLRIDLSKLPIPFRNTPDFILSTVDAISIFTTLGYYSEWSGYGSTRTKMPVERKLQYYPKSWKKIGYPGPSKGYRALRGYLENAVIVENNTE